MAFLEQLKRMARATTAHVGIAALVTCAAQAQTIDVHAGALSAVTGAQTRLRSDVFYELPGHIEGYTFIELQPNTYFSKTFLSRPLMHGIGPRVETTNPSEGTDEYALGLQQNISIPGHNSYANLKLLPLAFTSHGDRIRNTTMAGFAAGTGTQHIRVEIFGEWNLNNGEWGYGEVKAQYHIADDLKVGLHADLLNNDSAMPTAAVGLEATLNIRE